MARLTVIANLTTFPGPIVDTNLLIVDNDGAARAVGMVVEHQ
jgi:hypothetical protein